MRPPILTICLLLSPAAAVAGGQIPPTFTQDIAPILSAHCVACHRPGEAAPFSLLTFEAVRGRGPRIAEVVQRRAMPPWKPVHGFGGPFAGERRLTESQIQTIVEWVDHGMLHGDPQALPALPPPSSAWQLGEPDLVVAPPAYTLHASGADVFRNFVVPVPIARTKYVAGVEFRAGSGAVHHANLRFDRTRASRDLDARDPLPGYDGPASVTARYPDGYFLGWTPGQSPAVSSAGMAWRLEAGTDLVVQLHLRPLGRLEEVQPRVAFVFTDAPPTGSPLALRLGQQSIDIPPGEPFVTRDSYRLPVDVEVRSIHPHAHGRATRVRAWADLPDGTRTWLIRIDDWDFNWQDVYRYVDPVMLPRGSSIEVEFTYDNTANNPRNPDRPPRRVLYGQNSSDEMGDLWMQVVTASPADRARLVADVVPKALAEDTVGYEMLLRADPDDAVLKQGKAATHYNLGSLLASQRRLDEAVAEFRKAIEVRPDHSETHNNLGVVLKALGRTDEAIEAFRRAIATDPANMAARQNLAAIVRRK
jgi:hypothetical protein